MPQDQDDIKGADAMKQAPTPGPLSGDDVKLLVKGDLLRSNNGTFGTFLAQQHGKIAVEKKSGVLGGITITEAYFPDHWSFIGRPDADYWMPWSGGANPVPGQRVQRRTRNYESGIESSDDGDWGSDIIAFRLAPTAPVEASGSEREDAWRVTYGDGSGALFFLEEEADESIDEANTGGIKERMILATRRPQPSGETREVDDLINDEWSALVGDGPDAFANPASVCHDEFRTAIRGVLSALRPAPVASGGQHSSANDFPPGEVTDEWAERFCEAVNWSPDGQECKAVEGQVRCVSFRDLAKGYILSAIATQPAITSATAPVAETAGEAEQTDCKTCAGNGEIVTDWDRYLGAPQPGDQGDEGTADCPDCDGIGKVDVATPPVPAQDDDKLREGE